MANTELEFKSQSQESCYRRVSEYGRELFGESFMPDTTRPAFRMRFGSALINIQVDPWAEDDATVMVSAWVITKIELTPQLMEYLLHQNSLVRFGGFGIDEENDIHFEHTIVGSTCGKEELRVSVLAVSSSADEYDDKIKSCWGGERAID